MKVTPESLEIFVDFYKLDISKQDLQKNMAALKEVKQQLAKLESIKILRNFNEVNYVIKKGMLTITYSAYFNTPYKNSENLLEIYISTDEKYEDNTNKENSKLEAYFELGLQIFSHYSLDTILRVRHFDIKAFDQFLKNVEKLKLLQIYAVPKLNGAILDNLDPVLEATSIKSTFKTLKEKRVGLISEYTVEEGNAIKEAMNWLVPEAKVSNYDITDKLNLKKNNQHYVATHSILAGIVEAVYEYDNYRFALIHCIEYQYKLSTIKRLFMFSYKDPLYNYIDAGRKLLALSTYTKKNAADFIFSDDIEDFPALEIIDWLYNSTNHEVERMLTSTDIKFITKQYAEHLQKKHTEEKEEEELVKKLKTKIESLNNNKTLNINGVTITKNSITYANQVLEIYDSPSWAYIFMKKLSYAYALDKLNWDIIFDAFIANVSNKETSGKIGEVLYTIKIKETTNSLGISSTKIYLNDYRINKEEVEDCLRRAVCYTNQEDFDSFLSNVSSCSLKFHRYLQNGVNFMVDGLKGEVLYLNFPLERIKNLMYIHLGNKLIKIHDTNKFINLSKNRSLGAVIDALLGKGIVENVTKDDIKYILDEAKSSYEQSVERSKKLLEETEKTLNLTKKIDIVMKNEVTIKEGYIIQGKLRTYAVDNKDCKVYDYPSGRYICIVDKSTSQVGADKLINRLYALTNDSAIAKEVHTLN